MRSTFWFSMALVSVFSSSAALAADSDKNPAQVSIAGALGGYSAVRGVQAHHDLKQYRLEAEAFKSRAPEQLKELRTQGLRGQSVPTLNGIQYRAVRESVRPGDQIRFAYQTSPRGLEKKLRHQELARMSQMNAQSIDHVYRLSADEIISPSLTQKGSRRAVAVHHYARETSEMYQHRQAAANTFVTGAQFSASKMRAPRTAIKNIHEALDKKLNSLGGNAKVVAIDVLPARGLKKGRAGALMSTLAGVASISMVLMDSNDDRSVSERKIKESATVRSTLASVGATVKEKESRAASVF